MNTIGGIRCFSSCCRGPPFGLMFLHALDCLRGVRLVTLQCARKSVLALRLVFRAPLYKREVD